MDHVILAFRSPDKEVIPGLDDVPEEWMRRQELTLALADECWRRHKSRNCQFTLVGAAQGWDLESYGYSIKCLEKIGYQRIALGGLVPLKTPDLLALLKHLNEIKEKSTEFHLFGISRTEYVEDFAKFGVTSFDSTSSFRKAFKDNRNNYHFYDRNFTAIRVPMVDGSPKLKRAILAGEVSSTDAVLQERRCLEALRNFDNGEESVEEVLIELQKYEDICKEPKSRCAEYKETLEAKPWKACDCVICKSAGIQVAIFRGSERNKRRGMHNIHVFRNKISSLIT